MKPTNSVNRLSKRGWALAVLAAVAAVGWIIRPASAQVGEGDANGLIGSWRLTVNVTDQGDGALLQFRPSYIPALGVLETTHHVARRRINETQIAATAFSLAQGGPGTALNGAFFGTEQVSLQPVIFADGNSFSANWTSSGFDQAEIRQ